MNVHKTFDVHIDQVEVEVEPPLVKLPGVDIFLNPASKVVMVVMVVMAMIIVIMVMVMGKFQKIRQQGGSGYD